MHMPKILVDELGKGLGIPGIILVPWGPKGPYFSESWIILNYL